MIALLVLAATLVSPTTLPDRVVLFDGRDFANFTHRDGKPVQWKILDGGAMQAVPGAGDIVAIVRQPSEDFLLHVEFMVPQLPPEAKGQERGNSGVYLLGRYEVQVLDSFEQPSTPGDCGAIYGVKAPDRNVCKPPGQWQTYDITFRSPVWEMGRKVMSARITVVHNGVTVQEDVEIPNPTGSEIGKEAPGPLPVLMLQEHGHPVQFRNVWVEPLKEPR